MVRILIINETKRCHKCDYVCEIDLISDMQEHQVTDQFKEKLQV